MITVATISLYIHTAEPEMTRASRDSFAAIIYEESHCSRGKCEIAPSFIVSFLDHESRFSSDAIGDHGKAIGLGQSHSWLYSSACASNSDPMGAPSPACKQKRDALLDPRNAIHQTAIEIRNARDTCRRTIHDSQTFQWISLMGGRNQPSPLFQGVQCGMVMSGKRWRPAQWRKEPRFKEIREIVDCEQNLKRNRPCRREDPSDVASKSVRRHSRTTSTRMRSTKS